MRVPVSACYCNWVIQPPCQIISWMVSKLSTDTLTERAALITSLDEGLVHGERCNKNIS